MENPLTPLAHTRQGSVLGCSEDAFHVWRGIPFAAPPTGALRWRAPQPPQSWQGVRITDTFSAASWQNSDYCQQVGGGDPGRFSEDCLYLNIWSPASGCTAAGLLSAPAGCHRMTEKRLRHAASCW